MIIEQVIIAQLIVLSNQLHLVGAKMSKSIKSVLNSVRESDRKIINLIISSGGQVFEKDIRSTLDEPRTTIWRTIKRLEDRGIIIVTKFHHQNLVKISDNFE